MSRISFTLLMETITNIQISKEDLDTYPLRDLQLLAEYYKLEPTLPRQDLSLMIALELITNYQKGNMSGYTKQQTPPTSQYIGGNGEQLPSGYTKQQKPPTSQYVGGDREQLPSGYFKTIKEQQEQQESCGLHDILLDSRVMDCDEFDRHYEKLVPLGRGEHGDTYKYRDLDTGEFVAIKKIPYDPFKDIGYEQEFRVLEELKNKSGICSKYVMCYIDHFIYDCPDGCYLMVVLQYIEGNTLQASIKEFNKKDINKILCQVLLGLLYLHANDIVHRDIHLGNVILSDDRAVLVDFGLSCNAVNNCDWTGQINSFITRPKYYLEKIDGGYDIEQSLIKNDLYAALLMAYQLYNKQIESPLYDLYEPAVAYFTKPTLKTEKALRKAVKNWRIEAQDPDLVKIVDYLNGDKELTSVEDLLDDFSCF